MAVTERAYQVFLGRWTKVLTPVFLGICAHKRRHEREHELGERSCKGTVSKWKQPASSNSKLRFGSVSYGECGRRSGMALQGRNQITRQLGRRRAISAARLRVPHPTSTASPS